MRRVGSLRRMVTVLAVLAAGLVACQIIVGIEDDDGATRPARHGDAEAPCTLLKPPPAPTADGATAPDDGTIRYYAVENVAIAPKNAPEVIGFDLDDHCTGLPTRPDASTAASDPPCAAPAGGTVPTDFDGGVDNALRDLFVTFSAVLKTHDSPDKPANFFNDDIQAGKRTLVIALGGYNGGADDTEVSVGLIPSEGLDSTLDAGPRWNGEDTWTHADEWFNDAPGLPLRGYVTNHVLVTYPKEFQLVFGSFSMALREGSIIGTIDPNAPGGLTGGVIVGRAIANDFIAATGQISVQNKYCNLSGTTLIVDQVCSSRDIGRAPGGDASATCDAISVGFGFTAVRAAVNPAAKKKPLIVPCDAALTCPP